MLWRQVASGVIHSELVLTITNYLFSSIWYLLYIAYAAIGFGLWKLRAWARKAVFALSGFGASACVLTLPFLVRPWAAATATFIGIMIAVSWAVWYLNRPRVRFAFGVWPTIQNGVSTVEPPPELSKIGKVWVVVAIAASFGLFLGSILVASESMIRASAIYQITLKQAQDSPCVTTALGTPLTPGWRASGNWTEGDAEGSAKLGIPVHGSKGKGSLAVDAEKLDGVWKITSLVLVHDSTQIQIMPPNSTSSCQ